MKPRTSYTCMGKIKKSSYFPSACYEISQISQGYLDTEPGILVPGVVVNINKRRTFPLLIVNATHKTINLRKNCIIAQAERAQAINSIQGDADRSDRTLQKQTTIISDDWVNNVKCPEEHKVAVHQLIKNHRDVFALSDQELTQTDTVTMTINTGNAEPIRQKPYFTPLKNRAYVDKAIDDMLSTGIIENSTSPWSSPIVIVPKKDGTKRFCVDYRKLNAVTIPNSHPLPKIDEILALLGGSKYFSALDCRQGYFQIKMDPTDKEKTSFCCSRGLFQFTVMPFGLRNAPATYQHLMYIVLQDFSHFAFPYLDDKIVFSPTLEQHFQHLEMVFDRLRQHNLKLKPTKCHFAKKETNYLGFVVNGNGIKPDLDKIQAIRDLPIPTSIKDVRAFIGMCSYYRRIIPNFSKIAEPLVALTRKNSRFKWDEVCSQSYEKLKADLTTVPLLGYPDITKPFKIYTDASDNAIGAVLVQDCGPEESIIPGIPNEKPIHFYSHKLSKSQQKWSTIEKETFSIKMALEKFDPYIHGCTVTLFTDHKPCIYLLSSPMQNRKIQQWALSISGYDVTIKWLAGKRNSC